MASHGSPPNPWVGSGGFHGLACGVGSDQEVFEVSRVRSGLEVINLPGRVEIP